MGKIDTDKKLALIQDIRQENQYNRMKCRERERFLYGNAPMDDRQGELYSTEAASLTGKITGIPSAQESRNGISGFRIRLLLSIFLLGAFIFWNYSGIELYNMTAEMLYEALTESIELSLLTDL